MSSKTTNGPTVNPNPRDAGGDNLQDPFAQLPTETEIYILPGGEIVIADLPAELAVRLQPDELATSVDTTDDPAARPAATSFSSSGLLPSPIEQ